MITASKYWEAIAVGMQADNQKLELFVTHKLSLGIAREGTGWPDGPTSNGGEPETGQWRQYLG
jgi:hypothetical protein